MPEQQLAGAQVARPPVDQRDLRPAQAVRPTYPAGSRPIRATHSLTSRPYWRVVRCSPGRLRLGKQPVARSQTLQFEPSRQRLSGRLGQLERDGPAGFLLDDGGTRVDAVAEVDVGHAQADEVAAAQLAVDGGVEQGEVAGAALVLQAGTDCPDVLGFEGRLGADEAAEVPRSAGGGVGRRYNGTPFEEPSASHPDPDPPAPQLRARGLSRSRGRGVACRPRCG